MVIMKKNKLISKILILILFLSVGACTGVRKSKTSASPHGDLIPDEKTAITVAEAIWLPIFGKRIYEQKPFVAFLMDGKVWLVSGTLKTEIGGVVSIKIQKSDGKILEVLHGK